jgi:hypothetical protein
MVFKNVAVQAPRVMQAESRTLSACLATDSYELKAPDTKNGRVS